MQLLILTMRMDRFGSSYLAELFLVLGHFLQHLGQVPHGGLWEEGSTRSHSNGPELRGWARGGGRRTGQQPAPDSRVLTL